MAVDRKRGIWLWAGTAGCCVALVGGCAGLSEAPTADVPQDTASVSHHPGEREPAPTGAPLRLFGEVGAAADVPFVAQAVLSMKQHTFANEGGDADPDVAPNADTIVFSSTRHGVVPHLYLQSVDGVAVTQLTSGHGADVQPSFSPDGRHVAFASNRSGNWDIWIVGIEDKKLVQVTESEDPELHPSWSPDGTQLVYCRHNRRARRWELWITDVKKAAGAKFIGDGLYPEWSPVGQAIVYQRPRERGSRWFSVWRMELENGEPRLPVELASSSTRALIQPAWSPDGRLVAYCEVAPAASSVDPGDEGAAAAVPRSSIWVMESDGRSPMQLTHGEDGDYGPAWGTDGRVYFTSTRGGPETVWSLLPLTGPTTSPDTRRADVATAQASLEPR